jgi:hypothetical protein
LRKEANCLVCREDDVSAYTFRNKKWLKEQFLVVKGLIAMKM